MARKALGRDKDSYFESLQIKNMGHFEENVDE
jgi:hypothetical protein